ncbi:MAG: tetratricopeptide repeat protein [candidate division Zixibacteria bacterium]|nr:tetratricopeptide repeat protein [candidate division Zixibacteria bacterium]
MLKNIAKTALFVSPALAIYSFLAIKLNVIQDDAYISYRYVANFLNGDGLVFNIGEQIEGFTNFAWVIYMIALGGIGGDYVFLSRVTGFLFGGGLIVMTFLLARLVLSERDKWFAVLSSLLVGLNMSIAYWSPAGLETAAFAFCTMLCLYFYLRRSWLLVAAMAITVWLRPEGALVTGLLIAVEWLSEWKIPRFTLRCAAIALLTSLPYVGFKLLYYGSILPNSFYAKTGFDLDKLKSGVEYAWLYFKQFGWLGIPYIVAFVYYKRLSKSARAILLLAVLYIAYIVLVGGDFLKVLRFFIPIFGMAAVILVLAARMLLQNLVERTRLLVIFMVSLPLLFFSWNLPVDDVNHFAFYEHFFLRKMKFMAESMKKTDSTNFSVAVPTIGIFGYELIGHKIIDMVGLTDSTIARHSEPPIPGMKTTWKEDKHNSKYLLESAPDYILFSTGKKPSAPAERALLLYPQFMNSYRAVGWFYRARESQTTGVMNPAFKRMREITGEIVPSYPVGYVENYKRGLDAYVQQDHRKAIGFFDRALALSPDPPYVYLVYQKAFCLMAIGKVPQALPILDQLLQRDSLLFEAHRDLYFYSLLGGDSAKAATHAGWVEKLTPWYWPKVKRDVARRMESFQAEFRRRELEKQKQEGAGK